jgi:hypothetical protein
VSPVKYKHCFYIQEDEILQPQLTSDNYAHVLIKSLHMWNSEQISAPILGLWGALEGPLVSFFITEPF